MSDSDDEELSVEDVEDSEDGGVGGLWMRTEGRSNPCDKQSHIPFSRHVTPVDRIATGGDLIIK